MGTSLARHNPASCEDTLAFLQATHAVLPLVLLSWQSAQCGGPGAAHADAVASGSREGAQLVAGQGPAEPAQQAQQAQRRWWCRQPGAALDGGVWSASDAWVRTLCGARLGTLGRLAFVLWLVAALFVVVTF